MAERPKKTDKMGDVLKMQNDYLRDINEGKIKPAVSTIKLSGRFIGRSN